MLAIDTGCAEAQRGGDICGIASFISTTTKTLEEFVEFKAAATISLNKIEKLEESMEKVAEHAGNMDKTLKDMEGTAKELISIATGKKQVPLAIFYAVVIFLGAWMMIDKLANNHNEVSLSPTSFSFKPRQQGGQQDERGADRP